MVHLSVIIPTYNRCTLLVNAIQSIQHCGLRDVEIIVVDDGSTDGTEKVVKELRGEVVYLRQSNSGPAAARNLGLRHSRGRFVAFLDSDDQWLPDVPSRVLDALERAPDIAGVFADARVCGADLAEILWLDFTGVRARLEQMPQSERSGGLRVYERRPFFRLLVERCAILPSATILRREALLDVEHFDPELRGGEDWELSMRLASRHEFGCWPEPMSIYLKHPNSLTADVDSLTRDLGRALRKCSQKCPHLDSAERKFMRQREYQHFFSYAYFAWDRGDYQTARRRFGALLAEGYLRRWVPLFWLVSCLPFGLPRRVRQLRRRVAG
jgi:glycosyltransferase involved in cell wall biosynthesis